MYANRIYKIVVTLFLVLLLKPTCILHASEQPAPIETQAIPFERGLEKILLELKAAEGGLSALCLSVGPNANDGATWAWMRRVAGIELHTCFVTRSEAADNENGSDTGNTLALVRTIETEAVAKILGHNVWYLNQPDSGYSKSLDEMFSGNPIFWDQTDTLARLVRIIRTIQPDILFTLENTGTHGPGQQQAIESLIQQAYASAADPKQFSNQISKAGLKPWQAAKLYQCFRSPQENTLQLNVSQPEPLSGRTPIELATWANSQKNSLGKTNSTQATPSKHRWFRLIKTTQKSQEIEKDLRAGLHLLPLPVALLSDQFFLNQSIKYAKITSPIASLTNGALKERKKLSEKICWLLYAAQATESKLSSPDSNTPASVRARAKRRTKHLRTAAALSLGLRISVQASDRITVAGEKVSLNITLFNNGSQDITMKACKLRTEAGWQSTTIDLTPKTVRPGTSHVVTSTVEASKKAFPTYPAIRYIFDRIESRTPIDCAVTVTVQLNQVLANETHSVTFTLPTQSVPVELAPRTEYYFPKAPVILFDDPNHQPNDLVLCKTRLTMINHQQNSPTYYAKINDNKHIRAQMERNSSFAFTTEEQRIRAVFRFMVPVKSFSPSTFKASSTLWSKAYRLAHPPAAEFKRIPISLPTPLSIAIVQGNYQATWNALTLLKATFEDLQLEQLTPMLLSENDLTQYHTIILDVRVMQDRPDVLLQKERLKKYMDQGGHVICFLQDLHTTDITKATAQDHKNLLPLAPYPITLSNKRITNEAAPVRLLDSEHTLLSVPCKITENAFTGWIQERGLNFPEKWDPRYQALLSSHDPKEAPLTGGLLFAKVGSGSFVYSSYVWSKQMQAGNRNAYRVFSNLISYSKIADQN